MRRATLHFQLASERGKTDDRARYAVLHGNLQGSFFFRQRDRETLISLDGCNSLAVNENIKRHCEPEISRVSIKLNVLDDQRLNSPDCAVFFAGSVE